MSVLRQMNVERSGGIGATLRAARERKGVSLRQIADRTKIAVGVLEALERNDISRLPGGLFSRAFVRSYANEVGLDTEATIQEFMAQFPQDSVTAGHPRTDRVEDTELFESDRRVASSVLWLFLISVPLAIGVLYFGLTRRSASEPVEPPPVVRAEPPPAAPTPPPDPAPAAAVDPAASTPSTPSSGPTPQAAAPQAAATPPAAAAETLTIALSARRPVWISATVDGQKAFGRLLQTGEQQTVEVKREMVITAGDASALKMTLNGSEARALGKTGEVVTAHLSLANFKEFLQTR